ncbi:MAG: twin-arginine translocation signal domain-containing protein [Planctomycetota bacterium]|jgi:hypothetical protein
MSAYSYSRRDFLKAMGLTTAAVTLSGCTCPIQANLG